MQSGSNIFNACTSICRVSFVMKMETKSIILVVETIARTSKTTIEEGKIQVSVLNLEKLHEEEERSCCVGKAGSQ